MNNKDLIISQDEISFKFNEWHKSKGHNILFITGISGSGKSTKAKELSKKYKAENISLDNYEHAANGTCKYSTEFMNANPKYKELSENNWNNHNEDDFYDGALLYIEWLFTKLYNLPNQLFIVEGLQLFTWGDEVVNRIKGKSIIIKTTTPEVCDYRVSLRDKKKNSKFGRHELPRLLRHYILLQHVMKDLGIEYELNAYDPPLDIEEIKRYYPDKANKLLKDPVHKWRAETGIELVHEEPSKEEQERIWTNWQRMSDRQKTQSDKKCIELTGLDNHELHLKIMKEKWGVEQMDESSKSTAKFPIFMVISSNPTPMGKAIKSLTGSSFSHASLSFDIGLEQMFSFSFKSLTDNGFVLENINQFKEMDKDEDNQSSYHLFVSLLSITKFNLLKEAISKYENDQANLHYNFTGLINYLTFKKPVKKTGTMFCSEFIATVLQDLDPSLMLNKVPNLMSPEDLSKNDKFYLLDTGRFSKFDSAKVQKKLDKFIKSKESLKYFTENSDIFGLAELQNTKVSEISQDYIFKNFAPTLMEPWPVITKKSFGGAYWHLIDMIDLPDEEFKNALMIYCQDGGNKYHVAGDDDLESLRYRLKLHRFVYSIFRKEGKVREQFAEHILTWKARVEQALSVEADTDIEARNQTLYELFWNPDDEFTQENRDKNLKNIDLFYRVYIGDLNEDSFFDRKDAFTDFSADLPDEVYLIPDARKYPVLGVAMLYQSIDKFEEVGEDFQQVFADNFTRMYDELNCQFDINPGSSLIKFLPRFKTTATLIGGTRAERDELLSAIFSESTSHILEGDPKFTLDADSKKMIADKADADFESHYVYTIQWLPRYAKIGDNEKIIIEICRLFYMLKVVSCLILQAEKTDDRPEIKRLHWLRKRITLTYKYQIIYISVGNPTFDFIEFFKLTEFYPALIDTLKSMNLPKNDPILKEILAL